MRTILFLFILLSFNLSLHAQSRDTILLWPDKVPGETEIKHPAKVAPDRNGDVTRLTNVSNPVLVVYPAKESNRNGKAVIVCPGGGYNILAVDKEGYEIAEWLSNHGYTAFVLQYRIPQKQAGALMDVQRAIRIVRNRSREWKVDPAHLGVMGFSAGGSLSARASTLYDLETYQAIDQIDQMSCRPDFTILIYPAYLDQGENRSLTPELKVNSSTPPMFIFATADDYYGNSALVMTGALRDVSVSVELHFLPSGGHGYGLRRGNKAAETWPGLLEAWLKTTHPF